MTTTRKGNGPGRDRAELELAQSSPQEQELLDEAKLYYSQEHAGILKAAWRLGGTVDRARQLSARGPGFVKRMAAALATTTNYLYKRMQLAETFTEGEIDRLADMQTRRGTPLTVSQVEQTFPLRDQAQRWHVLEQAARECWTYDQIRSEVSRLAPPDPRRARGPAIKTPTTVEDQVAQVIEMVPRWTDRLKAWTDDQAGFAALLAATPAVRYSAGWAQRLRLAASGAEQAAGLLSHLAEQAAACAERVEAATAPGPGPADGPAPAPAEEELVLQDAHFFDADGD